MNNYLEFPLNAQIIINVIKTFGLNINKNQEQLFLESAIKNWKDVVDKGIDEGITDKIKIVFNYTEKYDNINERTRNKLTNQLLDVATKKSNLELVKFVIFSKKSMYIKHTALRCAIKNNHLDGVLFILNTNGVDKTMSLRAKGILEDNIKLGNKFGKEILYFRKRIIELKNNENYIKEIDKQINTIKEFISDNVDFISSTTKIVKSLVNHKSTKITDDFIVHLLEQANPKYFGGLTCFLIDYLNLNSHKDLTKEKISLFKLLKIKKSSLKSNENNLSEMPPWQKRQIILKHVISNKIFKLRAEYTSGIKTALFALAIGGTVYKNQKQIIRKPLQGINNIYPKILGYLIDDMSLINISNILDKSRLSLIKSADSNNIDSFCKGFTIYKQARNSKQKNKTIFLNNINESFKKNIDKLLKNKSGYKRLK